MPHSTRASRRTTGHSPYAPAEPTDTTLNHPSPYEPIDSENGEIRLLELAPGKFDDEIVMHLIPHNLTADSEPQTYEALSYAWGMGGCPHKARLNGISIVITTNLDCALRHLRITLAPRPLWIDAISID
ncbi:hypothetical protein EK21DRAFT_59703 [Setomelanomma holmii]|uniref:Heterokaryon incompatibility domain-containing protein n=1 Tax=Setomelanomma holmii TaxID=210430 RepID=A0A9P4LRQ5_9PLEO|nr:hypothetical protein EK21DRAFT_59703 [Setomelanomma holmii]